MKSKNQNVEDVYPLSPMQQGMLFHSVFAPASGVYIGQSTYELHGNLDIFALELSWQQVIERHSILRTAFVWANLEKPIQVVGRSVKLPLLKHDWRGLSVSQQQQQLETFMQTDRHQDFELSKAPLMRLNLIQLSDEIYYLILTHHHLVLDGWSLPLLFGEVIACYEAFRRGQKLSLSRPIPYRNYIAWLQKQDLFQAQKFWQKYLQGFTAPTPLGVEQNTHHLVNHNKNAAVQQLCLSAETTSELQAFARKHRLTLNTIVQGVWALLLNRYGNETDVVFGATSAGRPVDLIGAETMIGNLINTLPVRVQIDFKESIISWMQRLQVQQIESRQYEYCSLIDIQAGSEVARGVPLFESIIVFENYPKDASLQQRVGSLQIRKVNSILETNYPLTVLVGAFPNFYLNILYERDRFADATITRMLGHLQTMLVNIIAHPERCLADLPLLTEAELHQVLQEWNNTSQEYPLDKCIHQLFAEQVERTPDAVAVVFENQQLTYRQLNQQANQLAHYLQKLGVGPEVLVGICVERSPLMVIGLLGILKAGGAYVPLDPSYPQQRLAFMLENSQTPILLCQHHLAENLPTDKTQLLCLDINWKQIAQESKENPVCNIQPENLAYVIYTSGSTGKPKGAMNSHQGICNRLLWMQDTYQLTAVDCVLQKTPFSFDVSVWEFFWPLLTGARLVIARPDGHRDPTYLVNLVQQEQLTTLHFVPSMLQAFLESEGLENCKSLKRVICSGEALSVELQKRFFNRLQAELHNLYGPTEAAIDVTYWMCSLDSTHHQTVPIGSPIANTQIYLLDKYFHPVPVGVIGELYIGGVGVGRGYLRNPKLTAEKFIPNPFCTKAGERLYRTGDLARYLPDGNIEFLGRIDHQVKVRGFRIELGEIEAAINQHPAIQASVVIAQAEGRLVAYWVAKQQPVPTMSDLRRFLGEKLPNYMIPAVFVQIPALPLTANGKIDKQALPAADYLRAESDQFVPPRTPTEVQLAQIWAEVLRVEQVGIEDNFFDLGGDSILTIQIVAKANQAGLQLTPQQLFKYQSIAELAAVCETNEIIQVEQGLVIGAVPLTPIQHWFFRQNLPDPHHFNQAVLLEVREAIAPNLLQQAIQHLSIHHDALRLRFEYTESGWQQIIAAPETELSLLRYDFSTLAAAEQPAAIEAAANKLQATFDLSSGLLVKVALFDLGTHRPNRLLIIIHHLAVDGVSWRILLEDLQTAYEQLDQGRVIKLPAKTTSFQKWSNQLQAYANSEVLAREQHYWLALSQEKIPPLPVDYPDGENTESSQQKVSIKLSTDQTQALLKEVPQAYNTQINDVLLTALGQTFADWTGNQSLLIELEGHGREEIFENVDLSRTVGWFTTIFPLHINLATAFDLGTALKIVKEQLRSVPQRGIGYGVLRYFSHDQQIKETLDSMPQAQVLFNYLGQFDQTFSQSSLFDFAQESSGLTRSLAGTKSHLLEINCLVTNSKLRVDWTYSKNLYRQTTIASLAQKFQEVLCELIDHCLSPEAGGYTPSDFPDVTLDQNQLEKVMAEMDLG
ncbi:amino acid adenylation domain-containing protein [Chlorogloeopsis sp. ULAP02]|uniref:amino acid adenylation domain-containing protein n=1 Tax=Chlorogloeopsis sp. ULAP02 TaxID=3107926 RepID=UPI003135E0A0